MVQAKKFTYPAHLLFTLVQYAIEHFSAEFPSVAALGAILVPIAISMAPITYYCAYKKTTGPKSHIWAAVAIFLVTLPLFKGLELGFPKDDPAEQAQANLDAFDDDEAVRTALRGVVGSFQVKAS